MPRHIAVLLLLVGAAALAQSARAQTPAERKTLDSMRASFAAVTDSNFLISYERRRMADARVDRENPFIHMELGYTAFRIGEITGATKRFSDAASEFQWAADLRPRWPYAWYSLGLAELSSGEADLIVIENIRQVLGMDAISQAVRSFARAVEIDPTFSAALVDLANAAMRQRIAPRLLVAQAALRQAAATAAGRVPEVQLVRGRIERRLLAHDSAIAAFHLYLVAGGDSAIGYVELARTFAQKTLPESTMTMYFAGVTRPVSDTARREIRKDLRWFASRDELAAFDAAAPDSVGAWLRRFWYGRDLNDGRRLGERLAEQFRRYQFSMENYKLVTRHRGFDVAFAYRDTSQQEFDDRGVVYLKHGEPTQRTRYQGAGYEPNESWVYRREPPDADLIVHFVALNDVSDYRLAESLLGICTRRHAGSGLIPTADAQVLAWRDCVESRSTLSPEYSRLAGMGPNASVNAWATERIATVGMARSVLTSDSYRLRFESALQPIVSLFTVGDGGLRPELHVVFAVPATRLHPRESDGGVTYPIALRMLVFDSASRMIAALDTVRVFRSAARLGAGAFLTEQLVLRVPPGQYRYTFVIEEPGMSAGDAVSNRRLEVPLLDGGFSASDVVLGREGSGLVWRRADGEVALNPLMRFPRDGDATIFYEVYGLPQGASVATRVRIARVGGRSVISRLFGRGGGSDLQYTTVTDAPGRTRIRQSLGLRGLAPGRYNLVVELTDPQSGQKLVRESPFEIEGSRSS